MAQLPSPPDATWFPLGNQFLNSASSVALTIPALPTGLGASGIQYGCIVMAQLVRQWIRLDGSAVTAAATGGIALDPGDFMVLRGQKAIQAVRVIRDADLGSLAVTHYMYRA